jgi:hypothetical protein
MLKINDRIGIPESTTSGIDSLDKCLNRQHYLSYNKRISYRYNSRGFRDDEWPDDLSDVIWCVGDSFTVGIGQPFEETWPHLLQQKTGKRCLNVGENGCANDTIAMRIQEIYRLYNPKLIVVMWSYLSRRYVKNFKAVNELPVPIINTIIPKALASTNIFNQIIKKNVGVNSCELISVEQLDWARDYHHFDIKTSEQVVDLIYRKSFDFGPK